MAMRDLAACLDQIRWLGDVRQYEGNKKLIASFERLLEKTVVTSTIKLCKEQITRLNKKQEELRERWPGKLD